jgi:hypothetical protein
MVLGPIIGNVFNSVNGSLSGISGTGGQQASQPAAQPTTGPTAAPTANPACASLLVAYQNASAAYCGNHSQCPGAYTNVVNAYNAYYGAGCH